MISGELHISIFTEEIFDFLTIHVRRAHSIATDEGFEGIPKRK